jgi:cytochrome P450
MTRLKLPPQRASPRLVMHAPQSIMIAAVALLALAFLELTLRRLFNRYLLSQLPKLPGDKLTHDALVAAGRSDWPDGLVQLPKTHGVLVSDPTIAWKLLRCDDGSVRRDMSAYSRFGFLDGTMLMQLQSTPSHRALRSALQQLFSPAATRAAHADLVSCTERLLDRIAAHVSSKGRDAPVPVYRLVQEYVLDVTGRAFLSCVISDADSRRLIAIFEEWLVAPPESEPRTPWARGVACARAWLSRTEPLEPLRLQKTYDAVLRRICDAMGAGAESEGTTKPVRSVAAALSTAREVPAGGAPEAAAHDAASFEATVRDQTAGLLFAGLNSASEVRSLIQLLAAHPELQSTARAEVDTALAGRSPTYSDLQPEATGAVPSTLDFCQRLVYESLRLAPGIEHLRLVTTRLTRVGAGCASGKGCGGSGGSGGGEGDDASSDGSGSSRSGSSVARRGVLLPAGTRLVVSPTSMHMHPRHWPQPCDAPRPEFFTRAAQKSRTPGSFLPFSTGAKGCPASGFALHEMRVLLVMLLQRFELAGAPGGGVLCTPRVASS